MSENETKPAAADELRPAKFVDMLGREWKLVLNYGIAAEIKRDLEVDFANAHDGRVMVAISDDMQKLVEVLYSICQAQAEKQAITPRSFAEGLGGQQMMNAWEALADCLVNFTLPIRRAPLLAIIEQIRTTQRRESELLTAKVNSPIVQNLIEKKVTQAGELFDRTIAGGMAGELLLKPPA